MSTGEFLNIEVDFKKVKEKRLFSSKSSESYNPMNDDLRDTKDNLDLNFIEVDSDPTLNS